MLFITYYVTHLLHIYIVHVLFILHRGTSGIDIDLQKVDIDQCDLPAGSSETNVFANSSKCIQETTDVCMCNL